MQRSTETRLETVAFRDQFRGAARDQRLRVVRLMIVHRGRKRHENRRQSDGAQFRQRQRAGAADDDIGPRIRGGHVVDECIDLRVDAGVRVNLFRLVEMLRSALMTNLRTLRHLAQRPAATSN